MNILAIDQAQDGAWSVFDFETKELIAYGSFNVKSSKYSYSKTILLIEQYIDTLIEPYDIRAIFIEDTNMRPSAILAFKRLAQLQGVLINYCEKNNIPYGVVITTSWQKLCRDVCKTLYKDFKDLSDQLKEEGYQASKIPSTVFVEKHYGLQTRNNNLADAIAIGYYAVHKFTFDGNVFTEQKEAKANGKRKSKKSIDQCAGEGAF